MLHPGRAVASAVTSVPPIDRLPRVTTGSAPGVQATRRSRKVTAGRSRSVNVPDSIVDTAPSGPAVVRSPVVWVVLSFRTSVVPSARASTASPERHSTAGVGRVSVPPSMSTTSTPDAFASGAPSAASAGAASAGVAIPSPRSIVAASATAALVLVLLRVLVRAVIGRPPCRSPR
ncbi:hypothetical protein DEJ16_06590 [Curtobacterium sp. MCJR17_055]|nr:hypothetical protein DEI87_02345 [Curtobacterium sp. MCBD17_029]PYY57007.1 hypothetical protein DEJ16_06590 [Curtobacterium sp. MCJR17_055]PYY62077.1 hypothetical protein DEJ26_00935 [Curtobacterium sp. MCPF17_015]